MKTFKNWNKTQKCNPLYFLNTMKTPTPTPTQLFSSLSIYKRDENMNIKHNFINRSFSQNLYPCDQIYFSEAWLYKIVL